MNDARVCLLVGAFALACTSEPAPPPLSGGDLAGLPRTVTQTITENGEPFTGSFNIQNTGDCPMTWSASLFVVSGGTWLSATPLPTAAAPATIAPGGMQAVSYTLSVKPPALAAPLAPGLYQSRLEITAACTTTMAPASGSPASVLFNLRVSPLDSVLVVGPDIEKDVVTLSNSGAGAWRKIAQRRVNPNLFDIPSRPTAVWTGRKVLLFGGSRTSVNGGLLAMADAYSFDPLTLAFDDLPTLNKPSARFGHSAVWTGSDMFIWGGCTGATVATFPGPAVYTTTPTGAFYNPASGRWGGANAVSVPAAPEARCGHEAVWTGERMLVAFGLQPGGTGLVPLEGGRDYAPTLAVNNTLGSWDSPISTQGAPAATGVLASFWTGRHFLVLTAPGNVRKYTPRSSVIGGAPAVDAPDVWTDTGRTLPAVGSAAAAFSGSKVLVWGSSGWVYDVVRNSMTPTQSMGAPPSSGANTAPIVAWTGSRFIVIARDAAGTTGIYNPSGAGSWTAGPTNVLPAPPPLTLETASPGPVVWTGKQLLVFVGNDVYSFE